MVAHAFNSSIRRQKQEILEVKVSLVYIVDFRHSYVYVVKTYL